jgi:hypothetical protein
LEGGIRVVQIIEQAMALADHHQQSPAGTVILGVGLQMLGEVVDALREQRDLHVGGTGIFFVQLELFNGLYFGIHTRLYS